ncbi:hypothetical protein JCM19241_4109 [Vibrio ishigakensis]|uniref:Inactive transglutaminase fused to 7 transmembrane helices domain-containing protein n=1 Tax=Vibrio ishigakensis TaxID=1481914 RepID=A0A0B8QHM5_9VIBR|nr:hypothetical protein JCM19241_4109 [Vibrio ishigakensis]
MTSRVPFYIFIALLIVAGATLMIQRHDSYGVPWTPGESRELWDVEARVELVANGEPVTVSLAAPSTQNGYTLVDESTSSPGYGVAFVTSDIGRRAEWTIRHAEGPQTIYYKAQFLVDPQAKVKPLQPEEIEPPTFDGPQEAAAQAIIAEATERSANDPTLARELIRKLNDENSQNAALLLNQFTKPEALAALLSYAEIPNKTVGVIQLEDGRRRQTIQPMVEVWNGEDWTLFNAETGAQGQDENTLI